MTTPRKKIPGKRGAPAKYKIGLAHQGQPDADGVRELVLECQDGEGPATRWFARCDASGKVLGYVRNTEQDRLSTHVIYVRRAVNKIAREAVKQLPLPLAGVS